MSVGFLTCSWEPQTCFGGTLWESVCWDNCWKILWMQLQKLCLHCLFPETQKTGVKASIWCLVLWLLQKYFLASQLPPTSLGGRWCSDLEQILKLFSILFFMRVDSKNTVREKFLQVNALITPTFLPAPVFQKQSGEKHFLEVF